MAAALLRARLAQRACSIPVDSAGFVSEGMPPPKGVLDAMTAVGIDLSEHRSRVLRPDLLDTAELVVGMTRQHVIDIAQVTPGAWTKSFTVAEVRIRGEGVGPRCPEEELGEWVGRLHHGRTRGSIVSLPLADDIPDPMGGRPRGYQKTRDVLALMAADLVDLIAPA